jgi:hypothetical protein
MYRSWVMWILVLVGGGVAAFFGLFAFLQWLSDRTYRPSRDEVRRILEASLEGRLDYKALDEFSCVRIAYDTRLDHLRQRYNAILDDPANVAGELTESNATPLNERGRARVRELIIELERLPARPADKGL